MPCSSEPKSNEVTMGFPIRSVRFDILRAVYGS